MEIELAQRPKHGEHIVHFYEHDDDLIDIVAAYLAHGLADGDAALVIATALHRADLTRALTEALTTDRDGRQRPLPATLVLLDAAETLDGFMRDGRPDPVAFDATVGAAVRELTSAGLSVCAFGEMVAVLWDHGNVAAAIELEVLWNDLCAAEPMTLFCGYRAAEGLDAHHADRYGAVCHLHTDVVGGAPTDPDSATYRRFPRSAHGPHLARRFVTGTLDEWGLASMSADCELVTSELSTNAIQHANSDFTVSMRNNGGSVRVTVGDIAAQPPRLRTSASTETGGRGLHLIARLSLQWGHTPVTGGKLVWADLPKPA